MRRALVAIAADNGPFTMPDAEGRDRIAAWGRRQDFPRPDLSTCVIECLTDEATMAEIEAHPDYLWLEDIVEHQPDV